MPEDTLQKKTLKSGVRLTRSAAGNSVKKHSISKIVLSQLVLADTNFLET